MDVMLGVLIGVPIGAISLLVGINLRDRIFKLGYYAAPYPTAKGSCSPYKAWAGKKEKK